MKKLITKSILAGLLIGIAACIYMSCENKVVGSLLFSIGLIAVIFLEANLYTGKIGYVDSFNKLGEAGVILAMNLLVAFMVGITYRLTVGTSTIMTAKLDKDWTRIIFDSIGCGACIYVAVEGYKKTKSFIPVILGVMAFILGGFEHCIAGAFYFGASELTWKGLLYIFLMIIGNSIGSLIIRWLQLDLEEKLWQL